MLLQLLKAKIHRATVTRSDLHYEGSIGIDELLMEAAGIVPFEAVHIWNVTNGERLQTYALPSPKGSGEICLNGAAARRAEVGDLVIIAAFGMYTEPDDLTQHVPRVVFVDAENRWLPEAVAHGIAE
jgi:aspartate 1-decarboxylase